MSLERQKERDIISAWNWPKKDHEEAWEEGRRQMGDVKPLRFVLRSLGCKVSQYDGEKLAMFLQEHGLVRLLEETAAVAADSPDLVILNGCAVTGRASQKARQALRAARRRWPGARIVLTGCEARLHGNRAQEVPDADLVWGWAATPQDREAFLAALTRPAAHMAVMPASSGKNSSDPPPSPPSPLPSAGQSLPAAESFLAGIGAAGGSTRPSPVLAADPPLADDAHVGPDSAAKAGTTELDSPGISGVRAPGVDGSRTRAFLKVQDGCRQFCTYCIVPHLRGPEQSVPRAEVVAEAHRLALAGFREVVLTGIHLGRYAYGLEELLAEICALDGITRVRLSSIEPGEVTDALLVWLASHPKACQFLHVPLQSGCDRVLKRMNRPYDTAGFAATVARIRRAVPRIGLSTDVIVGFPGETAADFAECRDFVAAMQFFRLHLFRFSPRTGTPAAGFPDQVAGPEKQRRARELEQIWHAGARAFHESFLGQPVDILWETRQDDFWHGFSREYLPCRLPAAGLPAQDLQNREEIRLVGQADAEGVVVL